VDTDGIPVLAQKVELISLAMQAVVDVDIVEVSVLPVELMKANDFVACIHYSPPQA